MTAFMRLKLGNDIRFCLHIYAFDPTHVPRTFRALTDVLMSRASGVGIQSAPVPFCTHNIYLPLSKNKKERIPHYMFPSQLWQEKSQPPTACFPARETYVVGGHILSASEKTCFWQLCPASKNNLRRSMSCPSRDWEGIQLSLRLGLTVCSFHQNTFLNSVRKIRVQLACPEFEDD